MENYSTQELEILLNDENYNFKDHYHFRSVLGKGGFGIVVEAISKTTFESLAIKVISCILKVDNRKEGGRKQ